MSDAIVAEVLFTLTRHTHYGQPRDAAAAAAQLTPLLKLESCVRYDKDACIDAIDLWSENPRISFVDALVAMTTRTRNASLATFDRRLQMVAGAAVWPPCRMEDAGA